MFEFLRKMIVPLMLIVLVAFIATIIFSWGGGGFQGAPNDTVGIIGGDKIAYADFDRYYNSLLRQEQRKSDVEITLAKAKEIRDQAWSQLVADHLMNKEVEKHGIFVTQKEVFDFLTYFPPTELQNSPQFMTDGKFDYQKYINAMPVPENAPFWAQVEQMVTPDLMKRKLAEDLYTAVRVTPAEVMEAFLVVNDKAKIGYVNLLGDDLLSGIAEPTEDQINEYYNSNKDDFKLKEQAVLNIVKFDKVASDNDWTITKYEIESIYDSIMAGADFTEMAQIFSDDGSAENGGGLGWFGPGRMVPPFDSAVFSMDVGEISHPVKTQFGWHLIKLLEKKTEKEVPRGKTVAENVTKCNAAHILLRVMPSPTTLQNIGDLAQEIADSTRAMGDLKTAGELFNYEVSTTGRFFENSFIDGNLRRNSTASHFAFSNKTGEVSDPIEDDNSLFVIELADRIPEGFTALDEAKGTVVRKIKDAMAIDKAGDSLLQIYDALSAGLAPTDIETRFGLPYNRTDYITRTSSIPGLGADPGILGAAFTMAEINQISKPIKHSKGYALVVLLDKQSPNLTEYSEKQDSIYTAVMIDKQREAYSAWFDQIVANADIEKLIDQFYAQ